jgi:hypothetical protein
MRKPIAAITGDLHFNLQTLELASSALRQLLSAAQGLNVPAVLNGDTLDQKAIVRGEVANRLIEILQEYDPERIFINTGNHDRLSEKADESSLNFLHPYAQVISYPTFIDCLGAYIVPYFNNSERLQELLNTVPKGSRLIMHQGLLGADMGHYVKDSTSLPREAFADFRVWSSHYHKRQDIKCGRPRKGAVGLFSYVGSAYTVTFAEANDGPKGINIGYDDGILELIPTGLRNHVVIDTTTEILHAADEDGADPFELPNPGDLVWLKLRGPASELAAVKKSYLAEILGTPHFKLDKIATETERLDDEDKAEAKSGGDLLDALIDKGDEPAPQKVALKTLWRELV